MDHRMERCCLPAFGVVHSAELREQLKSRYLGLFLPFGSPSFVLLHFSPYVCGVQQLDPGVC